MSWSAPPSENSAAKFDAVEEAQLIEYSSSKSGSIILEELAKKVREDEVPIVGGSATFLGDSSLTLQWGEEEIAKVMYQHLGATGIPENVKIVAARRNTFVPVKREQSHDKFSIPGIAGEIKSTASAIMLHGSRSKFETGHAGIVEKALEIETRLQGEFQSRSNSQIPVAP